jgi:hypothetical protein
MAGNQSVPFELAPDAFLRPIAPLWHAEEEDDHVCVSATSGVLLPKGRERLRAKVQTPNPSMGTDPW